MLAFVLTAVTAALGVVFAVSSAVHSYLILAYSEGDTVAMNVGFYYMANAAGRLTGTLLSGLLFQFGSVGACLWGATVFAACAGLVSLVLPPLDSGLALKDVSVDGGD